jgi:hypothetical protein
MTENSLSRRLVWRTLTDLASSNEIIRAYFAKKGVYGVEAQLQGMFRQCEAVWDAIPQTVQDSWQNNIHFYRKLLEKFDYKAQSPVLKDVPVAVVFDLLEELAPAAA